eukprot:10798926-Alexandrium_andersonii.AAC.1
MLSLRGFPGGGPAHLAIDNQDVLRHAHARMLARRPLRARPWQLVPNGDLKQAVDEAILRVGRSQ